MTTASISAIGKVLRGVSWDKTDASDVARPGYLPILRAGNIGNGLNINDDLVWVPATNVSDEQKIRAGDIAICMSSGSPAVVGKTASASADWPGSVGAFCALIRTNSARCLPEYTSSGQEFRFLKSLKYRVCGIPIVVAAGVDSGFLLPLQPRTPTRCRAHRARLQAQVTSDQVTTINTQYLPV